MRMIFFSFLIILCIHITTGYGQIVSHLLNIDEPKGALTPKSIVHNGNGVFAAQNMMYNHSICFYDRSFDLIKILKDKVKLSNYGFCDLDHWYQGSPVECDFSSDGRFAFVSNYKLYGKGFRSDADDNCRINGEHERGYIYKIDTDNFQIVEVFEVGSVPKYVYYLDGYNILAVSNWCSGTVSLIDLAQGKTTHEIAVGAYPRGLAFYEGQLMVALMGEDKVVSIDLEGGEITQRFEVGAGPRDLHVDSTKGLLYISLNNENALAVYDLRQKRIKVKRRLGQLPRSMALSENGQWLFVCLYGENKVAILDASNAKILSKITSCYKPIGIEYDDEKNQLWVACYGGEISIYSVINDPPGTTKDSLANEILSMNQSRDEEGEGNDQVLIICGSFREKRNAENRLKVLHDMGIDAAISSGKPYFRVYVTVEKEEAQEKKRAMQEKLGFELWLHGQ